ncbi:serine/threonine protein kinase [Persicimonas caeni]|uniref:non-specific serine/threonine protein kinase n=1 Tax=Persicimonas caeni TaxID=2292766 RepID=A0A4Y6PPX3_PERCE|nr:serine/threonine-protein kinase [Persicimonas caeni]QDG50368.1 serine/threonine protein kinase [Persicimonas caeni]QED31589.1 serine/threonine protein kinase [Persicimonas caeni]
MSSEQPTATKQAGLSEESSEVVPVNPPRYDGDLTGRVLSDRYLIEGCLGAGGMGTVYRAEHTLMKKTVAVKVLHPDVVGHGEAVERFRREAQAAAHIDHQNVCVATDFGEMAEGGFFLVMEYLEGNTLDETLVCVERFEPRRAIHIADQILAALHQAHSLGVVHRDLKPENIMLVKRDEDNDFVKIMDFGVARVRFGDEEDAKLTQAGRVYGTPMYMSPEQAAGAEDIDHRADLYTLGVMLFEMLTGTLPFVAKNPAQIMAMHMTEAPPSVRERIPEARIPKRLDRLVQKLMAKEPELRPSSAQEVREELEAIKQTGGTQSWMAFTRDAADTSGEAFRQVAHEVRPHIEQARTWVNENSVVRGVAMGAFAVLLAGLLVGPVVYLVWPEGGASTPEARIQEAKNLTEERDHYLADIDASNIVSVLATGDATKAVERLDKLDERHGPSAHLSFLQGRANAIVGDWTAALENYRTALELDGRYASEDRLVDDVVARYTSENDAQVELSEQILLEQLPEAVGTRRLSALARLGDTSAVRRRAKEALETSGRYDALPKWNRASIELRFAHGCDSHREQIDALVEAGDPRGLEVLRYYDRQPRSGCGTFKQSDCYGCIRKDLAEAISALEAKDEAQKDGGTDAAKTDADAKEAPTK